MRVPCLYAASAPCNGRLRLVCALAATLLAGACQASGAAEGDAIVLGLAGPDAPPGEVSAQMGAEFAVEEINRKGGIRGKKLQLLGRNDEGDPAKALEIAKEFVDNRRVVAVVGHVTSGATIAAAPVYDKHLPIVSPTATSPLVSQLGPWVFRVSASDSANAATLARSATQLGRRIAILYSNDNYGRGLANVVRRVLTTSGAQLLDTNPLLKDSPSADIAIYLRHLASERADLIFLATGDQLGRRIIDQARQMNLDVRFLGSDGLEPLASAGPAYEGVYVGLPYHPNDSPAAREFADAFRAQYGKNPDSYPASAYDVVHLLARAVEAVGEDRERIREYLEQVGRTGGSLPFQGVTGTLQFDPQGDPQEKPYSVWILRDGNFVSPDTRR